MNLYRHLMKGVGLRGSRSLHCLWNHTLPGLFSWKFAFVSFSMASKHLSSLHSQNLVGGPAMKNVWMKNKKWKLKNEIYHNKIKSYDGKINKNFCNGKMSKKKGSHCICLSVISIDSTFLKSLFHFQKTITTTNMLQVE